MRLVRQGLWFGITTVEDLDSTIQLLFGAPWIHGRVEYGLAIYSVDKPAQWLFRQGLRTAVVQIQVTPTLDGESRVAVFYDGHAVKEIVLSPVALPTGLAHCAVLKPKYAMVGSTATWMSSLLGPSGGCLPLPEQ